MFTGIIQTMGQVRSREEIAAGIQFTVLALDLAERLSPGDSVSINGVCQTVEIVSDEGFSVTAVGETLRRTTFESLRAGSEVNLEMAATPETALGGHLVQGHVDGVGAVESFEDVRQDRILTLRLPGDIGAYVIPRGSIAIDGVSLTVVEARPDDTITVAIVPFTMAKTIVNGYRKGTRVNIEIDMVAKYVKEYLLKICGGKGAEL